jgi:hypothetical protein
VVLYARASLLGTRSIKSDDECSDALLHLVQERSAVSVVAADMAIELVKQLVGFTRSGHIDCVCFCSHSSPLFEQRSGWVSRHADTSADPHN